MGARVGVGGGVPTIEGAMQGTGGTVMVYAIARRDVPEQRMVSVRERLATADMPAFVGRAYGELYGYLGRSGVTPGGEPFVIYHSFGPDGVDAEVCVPVTVEVEPTERIVARVLPATTVAETLHIGPYDELGEAYSALTGWIGFHGLEVVGPVRERYLNAPGPDVPPEAYRTVVEMPVAEAAIPVA